MLKSAVLEGDGLKTITYRKDADSRFYRALGYNNPADVEPKLRDAS